ncbi:hypothetical protein FPQ18DRAFT_338845 [Pyronema domesticum]|nr:hypothetical protein FPQ18DRAFT_338845 [Pyronema domesticum]
MILLHSLPSQPTIFYIFLLLLINFTSSSPTTPTSVNTDTNSGIPLIPHTPATNHLCPTTYSSCKAWGFPDICCPSGTSCSQNTTTHEITCCKNGYFCPSPINPSTMYISTSTASSMNANDGSGGWLYALIAAAYGVGNWRRRNW